MMKPAAPHVVGFFCTRERHQRTVRRVGFLLRNSKGQSFVEFTLLLPLLLTLVGGATDLGIALFASHIAQNAAREGARQAATLQANPCTGSPNGKTTAENRVRISALFSSFTANCSGPTTNPNTGQKEVTVAVSGQYSFSFLRLIGFRTPFTISRRATMRYEWP